MPIIQKTNTFVFGRYFMILTIILAFLSLDVYGQRKCVVVDAKTFEPIAHASLYAKDRQVFNSAVTDINGETIIKFPFRQLTISHLNYEKMVIKSLPDTIFLVPRSYMTGEVTVRSQEPAWIRPLLKRFVKNKDRNYFNKKSVLEYQYTTQSIAGTNYYKYDSQGLLRMRDPDSLKFSILQTDGTITSVDSTHLTDVANMRRMLYEDFVTEFDNDFIRNHKFAVNEEFKGNSKNEIELYFRMEKQNADHGHFVIDTARLVVLSAHRVSSLKYNENHRVSAFMLSMARLLTGYKITDWDTNYHVTYQEIDGNFLPKDIQFKFYYVAKERYPDKNEEEYNAKTGGGFTNMEAEMKLSPTVNEPLESNWLMLPQSWYIKYSTDKSREYEIKLANLPAKFILFDE
ncbi:MAG: hypothetical protein IKW98_05505 [Prevotella sp.]|nr:hypothetical protein [Prevotella sp.]